MLAGQYQILQKKQNTIPENVERCVPHALNAIQMNEYNPRYVSKRNSIGVRNQIQLMNRPMLHAIVCCISDDKWPLYWIWNAVQYREQ